MEMLSAMKESAIDRAKANIVNHTAISFMRFKGHRICARAKSVFKKNSTETGYRCIWELDGKKISQTKLSEFIKTIES